MSESNDYYIHPLYILITLVLGSITALFVGFSFAYIYSRVQNGERPVEIPILFYLNTIFLLMASAGLKMTQKAYETDNTKQYKILLWFVTIVSGIFLVMQIIAWRQLLEMNISVSTSTMSGYLYVLSGVHFTHVVAGLPFLVFFIYDAHKKLQEPASVLVYLSDPAKKRKLKVLSIYWHFVDILWIYLVVFLLLNRFFS